MCILYTAYIFRFAVCTRIPAPSLSHTDQSVNGCASLSGQSKRTCLSSAGRPDLITLTCGSHCYRWHPHISRQAPEWNLSLLDQSQLCDHRAKPAAVIPSGGRCEEVGRRWPRRHALCTKTKAIAAAYGSVKLPTTSAVIAFFPPVSNKPVLSVVWAVNYWYTYMCVCVRHCGCDMCAGLCWRRAG